MESFKQKRANLLNDNPIASHGSWLTKHSIAAGSPLHQGGSYENSPLEQRVQTLGSEPTGAEETIPLQVTLALVVGIILLEISHSITRSRLPLKQLATRIDVVSGDPLFDYNTTSGTVEMQGSNNYNGLRKSKKPSTWKTYQNLQQRRLSSVRNVMLKYLEQYRERNT